VDRFRGSIEVARPRAALSRRDRMPLAFLALFLFGCADQAGAAVVRAEVELMVPLLQRLEVEPAVLAFPAVTSTDLQAGYLGLGKPIELTVFSNAPWELCVRAIGEGGSRPENPVPATLLWSFDGQAFTPLTEEWAVTAAGEPGATGTRLHLQLRLPLGWIQSRPGVYQPRLEYRLRPREN
jgi:hypothetical protein